MTALTQPTAAQILGFVPVESGEPPVLGTLKEATITAYIAANPLTNVVAECTAYIRGFFSDPDNLSATVYHHAYAALIAACSYELLTLDMLNRQGIPSAEGGGIEIQAYQMKLTNFAYMAGSSLRQAGVTVDNRYHNVFIGSSTVIC